MYQKDAYGRIQRDKPSYSVGEDGRIVQVDPYGNRRHDKPQYVVHPPGTRVQRHICVSFRGIVTRRTFRAREVVGNVLQQSACCLASVVRTSPVTAGSTAVTGGSECYEGSCQCRRFFSLSPVRWRQAANPGHPRVPRVPRASRAARAGGVPGRRLAGHVVARIRSRGFVSESGQFNLSRLLGPSVFTLNGGRYRTAGAGNPTSSGRRALFTRPSP